MLVPQSDLHLQDQVIGRRPQDYGENAKLQEESLDIFSRLLKAHLDLEQSHEYLRQKLNERMKEQTWSLADLFEVADQDQKGYISVLDF